MPYEHDNQSHLLIIVSAALAVTPTSSATATSPSF